MKIHLRQNHFLKYLCMPATSDPAERLFFKASEVVYSRRSNIKSKDVDVLPSRVVLGKHDRPFMLFATM